MKKIGITGSLASGKTTASKIISEKRGPLFSADIAVRKLYRKKGFKNKINKKIKIKKDINIKNLLRKKILSDKSLLLKLEKIIHPLVRKEMKKFISKHKNKKFIFFEIPLLIENNLIKYFDIIIFIKAKKNLRLKRFILKGGDKNLFQILNNKQFNDQKKIRYCDYLVVNEKNLNILKRKLTGIMKKYE